MLLENTHTIHIFQTDFGVHPEFYSNDIEGKAVEA
jgi:hypothetical protein